jgi:hypothetical protein
MPRYVGIIGFKFHYMSHPQHVGALLRNILLLISIDSALHSHYLDVFRKQTMTRKARPLGDYERP